MDFPKEEARLLGKLQEDMAHALGIWTPLNIWTPRFVDLLSCFALPYMCFIRGLCLERDCGSNILVCCYPFLAKLNNAHRTKPPHVENAAKQVCPFG